MPLPAGTGLTRRSFMLRSAGLALAVYGAARARPARLRGGHRGGAAAAGPERDARLDLPLRRARRREPAAPRSATRTTRRCARRSALASRPARAFAEDDSLQLAPRRPTSSKTLHEEGKVTRAARRSATPTRTSRTSPAGTTGRSARPTRPAASAGSAATSTARATATTRCRASRSTARSRRRWRRPPTRSPRCPDPTTTASARQGVGGPIEAPMLDQFGALGGLADRRPAAGQGARRARLSTSRACASSSAPSPATPHGAGYPNDELRPSGWPRSRR